MSTVAARDKKSDTRVGRSNRCAAARRGRGTLSRAYAYGLYGAAVMRQTERD
jgi:hypothetical protein